MAFKFLTAFHSIKNFILQSDIISTHKLYINKLKQKFHKTILTFTAYYPLYQM